MNSAEQIRVVIVDEHALVRAGLRALLAGAAEVNVVADAAEASEAVALVRQTQAQVLITDRPLGDEDGQAIAELVTSAMIHTNLLVLTSASSPTTLESLLIAGARGYLTRTAGAHELVEAVRTVARGAQYRCPAGAARVSDAGRIPVADGERRQFERLTEREREVLIGTAHGYTAPEIGSRLSISAKTVDTYKQRIQEKLGLHHRSDYVRLVVKLRLMEAR